ncbi:GrpB family protein [Rummeliibacillus sp. NPDC094406]|uniref:GrpB family protein n=1 Tax=Rummeliibacillus sp. NPDC094406 TaxID=3364511 RepID=UPI0037F64B34
MLGLPRGEVFLIPWTSEWEKEFLVEKRQIENIIGQHTVAIHHIGSTSVSGLSAKPIIDIAIEIETFEEGLACVTGLKTLGYKYRGTAVLPERHYFNKGEPRTHRIHMYESGNKYLVEQLQFRDYLRNNKTARIEYEKLKQELSQMNIHDKHQYAEDKSNFVMSILNRINKKM